MTKNCFSFIVKAILGYGPNAFYLQLHFIFTVDSQLRQPCFCVLVCLSDMEAFLEFSKQSESGIKESEGKTAVVSGYPSLLSLNFFYIYLQKGRKEPLVCVSSSEFFKVCLKWRCCWFCPVLYLRLLPFFF